MAANVEKQQGHRAGVYKQKNKVHKHGKHRTKGEIERENKGKPGSVTKRCLTAGAACDRGLGSAKARVAFSTEFRGIVSSLENVVHICQVSLHVSL